MKKYLLGLVCLFLMSCGSSKRSVLDISGAWTVELDSTEVGLERGFTNVAFAQTITLPGTTDGAGLGVANTLKPALTKPQLLHLTRKNSYIGPAWYTREVEIPNNWDSKELMLNLERVLWRTDVWVDGVKVEQSQSSLVAPHVYNLTQLLKAGQKHRLTIRVDNRKQFDNSVTNLAHAYTDDTQIIWNGILGNMTIEALPKAHIETLFVTPNIETKSINVAVALQNSTPEIANGEIKLTAINKKTSKALASVKQTITIPNGQSTTVVDYAMGDDVELWSEFNPALYELRAELVSEAGESEMTTDFGMRKFSKDGSVLTINDKPLFLRGTLECCIFPLTGCPPMDKEGWKKVFESAKEWGLNHLRFHSWCPPKAAFEVADEMGFYLQVELPVWVLTIGKDQPTVEFMYSEGEKMIQQYGNHPSFCMWSMGNELQGDMTVLAQMTKDFRAKDPRHLYTTTSFTFEKGYGDWPETEDDIFITQWTKKGWVRGQGVFNSLSPTFDKDYSSAVDSMTVPLITHEIGQYAVYPKLDEIAKYTGVLEPLNFMAVRDDLQKKEMLDKAAKYTEASGKLAAILYKEEIERALKTAGISGYQLLDLHDFPGQGTALVGLLDAFWDSKGVITAEQFRQFSAPVVPLARFPKAVYTNNEQFVATVDVSNYSNENLNNQPISWSLIDEKAIIASGKTEANMPLGYNSNLAQISTKLDHLTKATKLTLQVNLDGTDYKNSWEIWVYPQEVELKYGDVTYTRNLKEAQKLLAEGKKVLLNPDWKNFNGIEGKFVQVFWSPVHFPKQAGTMGLLCDPAHAALADFPTDMQTNWQWWDLNINSTTMIIDSLEGGSAIVEMVDNFTNNRRLASLFEGAVGNGKLVVASFDLNGNMDQRPVAKQMLVSVLNYMNGAEFNPKPIKNPKSLEKILQPKANAIKESSTSIY